MSKRVGDIRHARLQNWVFHHWGRNGSMYVFGKRVGIFVGNLSYSVKWMIYKCGGCSWFRWEWGIWEFSVKGSVSAVGTRGWG